MHDIGPDRMVQHHHAHREHRLHSREFGTFSPIFIENLYRQLDIESQIRNPVLYVHLSMTDVVNEEEEGPKIKERLLALSLKYLDVCCVWDCSPYWVSFQRLISLFVNDAFIELFITLCIVVNTLFMALDHHGMNEEMSRALKMGNYVIRPF